MFCKRFCVVAAATLACALSPMLTQAAKPPKPGDGGGGALYTLTDLGGLTGVSSVQSQAIGVNNPDAEGLLQVVGFSYAPNRDQHAVAWDVTADGQVLDLADIAPPDCVDSRAWDVNDDGVILVAGYVFVPGKGLLTPPSFGGPASYASGINNLGDIVGSASDANGNERGALWHLDAQGNIAGPIDLGNFVPQDINDLGVMAGSQAIAELGEQGDLQVTPLELDPDQLYFEVFAINNLSEVVGRSSDANGRLHAYLWTPGNGMIPLGDLGGGESTAYDINDKGQIVGESFTSSGSLGQTAFLWENGVMVNLNNVTDVGSGRKDLQIAYGINETGHIVGLLKLGKPVSESHGFLLVPKPK